MTTKRDRKRKATPEQIEVAKARDTALATAADAALAEPDAVIDVANWLFTVTGTIRRFSLRNQTLLFNQAQERSGSMPTDVRAYRQWRDAGRVPRKGTAYYLTVPKGEQAVEGQADEQPADSGETGQGEEKATRTRFRTRPFWDITDTDGVDDADAVEPVDQASAPPAEPVDRAQAVWDRLAEQVAERDYTIARDGDAHGVDHDAKTVTIASVVDGHEVDTRTAAAALGVQLAAIITHGWATRTAIAPADLPEGVERIQLELGDYYGTATVDVSTNWDNGRTLYRIKAPRVHGAITVLPEEITYEHAVRPEGVDFHTGDYTTGSWPSDHRHKEAMHVNGIALSDGLRGLTFERVTGRGWNGHPWETRADRYVSRYQTRPAPDATSSRFSAVVRAVLLHWFARPDLAQVREVAARLAAPARKSEQDHKAARLAEEIAALQERKQLHEAQAAEFLPLVAPDETTTTAEDTPAADETAELALF